MPKPARTTSTQHDRNIYPGMSEPDHRIAIHSQLATGMISISIDFLRVLVKSHSVRSLHFPAQRRVT